MRKTILTAFAAFAFVTASNAQNNEISVIGGVGNNAEFSISYEHFKLNDSKEDVKDNEDVSSTKSKSNIYSIGAITQTAEGGNLSVTSTGFEVSAASRTYLGKNSSEFKGLYLQGGLKYGSVKFNENLSLGGFTSLNYNGTYSYFSFLNPQIGYKFMAGKLSVELLALASWKLEIKGKNDVDNKKFDNWDYRGGLKVGYRF